MRLGPGHGHAQQKLDFGEYLDGLYGYAMVLSRNRIEAEDLVQETCLRALRAVGGLRAAGSVKSWLFTILRNIWLNQLRRRRTTPDVIELDADENGAYEPADAAQDPLTGYVNRVEREQVRAAIQQLPLEFRETIILREYEELSCQEIAVLLDCPPGTVMSRLSRARAKLRDVLSGTHIATPKGGFCRIFCGGLGNECVAHVSCPMNAESKSGDVVFRFTSRPKCVIRKGVMDERNKHTQCFGVNRGARTALDDAGKSRVTRRR